MTARHRLAAVTFLSAIGVAGAALADRINTGDEAGTYHARICPELVQQLARSELAYSCRASSGTAENVRKVASRPR